MAWAKEQGSTWRWEVFAVTHGKRVGNYLLVSGDHTWADFDANRAFAALATARWRAEVSQHVASVGGGIYSMMMPFTRAPEDPSRLLSSRRSRRRPRICGTSRSAAESRARS